jgi:NAD(P)-dependent dehydrogenase (short-subunit alcohol dehydrogenase family)
MVDRMVHTVARLADKTALVTGATSNIGRAIAVAFAAEGAHVVVAGRSQERGAEVVKEIETAGGRADFVRADLDRSADASTALASEATRLLGGRIDILVSNAGVYPGDVTTATDEATFDRVYAVNVKAPFFLTAAVAPAMIAAGGGVIINLGSWIARLGIPDAIAHAAVYLASDEADFVHGAVIDVDGGRTTVAVVAA